MTEFDKADYEARMGKSIEALERDFSGLRTGRANPALLEQLTIDAYGSATPLKQIAGVSALDAQTLSISVWDPSLVSSIEKAISHSSLGISPRTEGNMIHISLPPLSGERRREYAKMASKYAEQARISIRNVRRDGMETIRQQEKDSNISQDEKHQLETELQKITDAHISLIDKALATKEQEIIGET